jgi:hypothetical protein
MRKMIRRRRRGGKREMGKKRKNHTRGRCREKSRKKGGDVGEGTERN